MKAFSGGLGVVWLVTMCLSGGWAEMVNESARAIPVAYDVDVVVVGGSTGGVAAAVAAAENGARVFLAAPRPYLGEDICATYRLWLEPGETPKSPLAQALFTPPHPVVSVQDGLKFTYETDRPSAGPHKDTDPPGKLADGQADNAVKQSVQYDGDVTIILDLGGEKKLGAVHLLAFQRNKDFALQDATVWLSKDRRDWRQAAVVRNENLGKGEFVESPLHLAAPIQGAARYVKILATKAPSAKRLLLGEIIIEPEKTGPSAPNRSAESARIPPMPMQVKRTLDNALLKAGVKFLYGCYPTDVLRDAEGHLAGIVMANRSGRQAVKAKVIIDATTTASVARMAGAAFQPYPAGPRTFLRTVVGGRAPDAKDVRARKLPSPVQIEQGGWGSNAYREAFEYTLTLPMRDASFASFAQAEQAARDLTWSPDQVAASETLFETPPDPIHARKRFSGPWRGADALDLDCIRPDKLDRLYVLGGCADVDRKAAERLMRPLAFLEVGARVGKMAAAEAKGPAKVENARVSGPPAGSQGPGDIREVLGGIRPGQTGLPTIHSDARSVPVLATYDVVVVGGGTGGAPAGIGAARQGAKTLVIEYLDGLGGVGTLGLIGTYYYGYRGGFTGEVDKGVAAMGAKPEKVSPSWNVEWKMEWYRRELRKAGADIWFGALGCGAWVENGRAKGVVVATPEGRGVVLAKVVVDSTGNADVALAAGAEHMPVREAHVAVQGTGMPPRTPGEHYTNTDYTITDDSDTVDAWRTFVSGRNKYKDSYDLSQIIDSRERRQIVGDFVISPLDIWNRRTYPDTIALSKSNFDTHGFTVHALFALKMPYKDEVSAYTPYRALLPKGLEGILVTGLGIGAHRDAMPILRMQPDIQNQGYAAGVAAAMAAKAGVPLRGIDIRTLQQRLVEKGNLPASVLSDHDSYPMSRENIQAAVASLVPNYDGVAVILAQPQDALPLLRAAYQTESKEDAKLVYAHVLGMLGDPTGAATLAHAVAAGRWDRGWSFTGSGQYGGSLSPLDSLIVALARTHDKGALEVILDKAATLDANSAFSHHRAVAIALETLSSPDAAKTLAELLGKPGMTGFACADIQTAEKTAKLPNPNLDLDRSIRELLLARALYRCGDYKGVGEKILKTYEGDLRGHLAQHAHIVLQERLYPPQPEPAESLDIETSRNRSG